MLSLKHLRDFTNNFRKKSGIGCACEEVCKFECECDFDTQPEFTVKNEGNVLARIEICDVLKLKALKRKELIEAYTEYERLSRLQFIEQDLYEVPDPNYPSVTQSFMFPNQLNEFLTDAISDEINKNLQELAPGELKAAAHELFEHTVILDKCKICPNKITGLLFEFCNVNYEPITIIPLDKFTIHLIGLSNARKFFTVTRRETSINLTDIFPNNTGKACIRVDILGQCENPKLYEILVLDSRISHRQMLDNIGNGHTKALLFTDTEAEGIVHNNEIYYKFPNYEYLVRIKKEYYGNIGQYSIISRYEIGDKIVSVGGFPSIVLTKDMKDALGGAFDSTYMVLAKKEPDKLGRHKILFLKNYTVI